MGTSGPNPYGIICPQCGTKGTRVIDSRPADESAAIRRRRRCRKCHGRFTTYERTDVLIPSSAALLRHIEIALTAAMTMTEHLSTMRTALAATEELERR